MNNPFETLFDLSAVAPKKSITDKDFLTLPHPLPRNWAPEASLWKRTNGKKHTYSSGNTLDCTLEWCIHNFNQAAARNDPKFKFRTGINGTFETWAKGANCSVEYLKESIRRHPKYKFSPIGSHV